LVGWSGVGKSHIIRAPEQKACVHSYRALCRTSAQLLADLTASLADKTLPAKLRRYASPDLLVIDEFGFDLIERTERPQAAHPLYKIIASRSPRWTPKTGHRWTPFTRPSLAAFHLTPERFGSRAEWVQIAPQSNSNF
jgi:DNA replication protein DnaC